MAVCCWDLFACRRHILQENTSRRQRQVSGGELSELRNARFRDSSVYELSLSDDERPFLSNVALEEVSCVRDKIDRNIHRLTKRLSNGIFQITFCCCCCCCFVNSC